MPALIAHHLYGEEAARALPGEIVSHQEDLLAFLVGSQGPDPLFFRWSAGRGRVASCRSLAHRMHSSSMTRAFEALRASVSCLPRGDSGVGRAFVLGFLAHYLLDSTTHPFVIAQQRAICSAGTGLDDAEGEVHALIEGELDSMLLWRARHESVLVRPAVGVLAHTPRIDRVGGALLSQVAATVYSTAVGPEEYARSIRDMESCYRHAEPVGSSCGRVVGDVERLWHRHSQVQALAHPVVDTDECVADNRAHHLWRDPYTGAASEESFSDLYRQALAAWPAAEEALLSHGDLATLVGHVNYYGRRLSPSEEGPADGRS